MNRPPTARTRRSRRLARGCVSFAPFVPLLATQLPAQAQSAGPASLQGVDPALAPYVKPAPIEPLTAEERLPVIDLSELPGLWPKDVVEAVPGKLDPVSPSDAVKGAKLLTSKDPALRHTGPRRFAIDP